MVVEGLFRVPHGDRSINEYKRRIVQLKEMKINLLTLQCPVQQNYFYKEDTGT